MIRNAEVFVNCTEALRRGSRKRSWRHTIEKYKVKVATATFEVVKKSLHDID